MKNSKSPSKYSRTFYLSDGNIGEISVRYELPLCFVLVSFLFEVILSCILSVFFCYCHRAGQQMAPESLALYRCETRHPICI